MKNGPENRRVSVDAIMHIGEIAANAA